jgi:hypothetical protein
MQLLAALISMLHWSRRVPNRLWSAFKEGPPSIPAFLIRNHLLEWACLLRVGGGLRYVTTEVTKVMLEFAAPFFAWEWRGRLYTLCWFGGRLDSGLSRLWRAVRVRIVDVLDVG